MHKNAMKCNKTLSKWCKNKHGASKIMDTLEMYQAAVNIHWKTSIHCIYLYTKCLSIERKLDFVVITFVLCFSLYQILTSKLLWDPGIVYRTLTKEEGHAKVQVSS
jgi:hypothetical protein